MSKIDLKRELKRFYTAKRKPEIVEVPAGKFLAITGRGAPGGEAYQRALRALYSTVYALKSMAKKRGQDFVVMPLEGLWWWDKPTAEPPPREEWNWKMMVRVPDFITGEMVEAAKRETLRRKGIEEIEGVSLELFDEGLSAQVLHIGPYSEEASTIRRLHSFIAEKGYEIKGHHHEIYLSDPRRTPPERLKTILRQPIKKAAAEESHPSNTL